MPGSREPAIAAAGAGPCRAGGKGPRGRDLLDGGVQTQEPTAPRPRQNATLSNEKISASLNETVRETGSGSPAASDQVNAKHLSDLIQLTKAPIGQMDKSGTVP